MDNPVHLTDEQFTALLLGDDSSSARAHLAACPQCAAEAAQFSGAIGDFRQQSTRWAERRAATHSAAPQQRERLWAGRPPVWAAAALAFVVVAGAGLGIYRDRNSASPQSAQSHATAQLSPATLKSDNDLLSAIDGELRVDELASAASYRLSAGQHTEGTKPARRSISE